MKFIIDLQCFVIFLESVQKKKKKKKKMNNNITMHNSYARINKIKYAKVEKKSRVQNVKANNNRYYTSYLS